MAKFKTRARAVDMLGRQQIAGIPNSISELFKNAHDAYATRVEVDFYRTERLLVLRDDGLGMTMEDVQERWLVLGTESKLGGGSELAETAASQNLQPRIPLGEKGIGRLAIAAIGPQVLLLTRARRTTGLSPTVASFINWSLFALPGISLDEIDVPVKEFPYGTLPNADDLASLVEAVKRNFDAIRSRVEPTLAAEIDAQLDQVDFDPADLQRRFQIAALDGPVAGTQFYIQPTDTMLELSLDTRPQQRRTGDLQRFLMGFTNTMVPGSTAPPIVVGFTDHRSAELSDSVIGPEEFFTPLEFESADHHFQGKFDEYGQFTGTVGIYGGEPQPHTVAWPEARGRITDCGAFTINFAYVQGAARESRIPREQWEGLTTKLSAIGGLYIYRNGIRILPYGNTDFDFIQIEQRRNLSAQYYFFAYRRMFGAIELPTESSSRLVEKAGREGFRDNRAYRDFRAILENFFVQLAADFFREEATWGTQFKETKSELDRRTRARERQARQSLAKRRQLADALNTRATKLSTDEPREAVESAILKLTAELAGAKRIEEKEHQIQAVLNAENSARRRISEIKEEFRISEPRGVGLSRALRRDLTAYRMEFAKLDEEVFTPAFSEIDEAVRRINIDVNRRRRFDAGAEAAQSAARALIAEPQRASRAILQETSKRVTDVVREATEEFEATLGKIGQRLQRTDLNDLSDAEIVQLSLDLDNEIEGVAIEKRELLEAISQQLEAITFTRDESGEIMTQLDMEGAAEDELLALSERAEADLELTQLGMAIEIIDHEFQATIGSVRSNLTRLRAWANVNEQLRDVYNGIRVNFEHLDGYLTLFTPLHRRLYRSPIEIKGSEISKFLNDLFNDRLGRHSIRIETTGAFRAHRITGYPSTFYPVFVNLVDNAIFWLQDQPQPRVIRLDADQEAMLINDNGPGVQTRDREAIFDIGFTRKPGGRGLGLYISRDVLNKAGYDLTIVEPGDREGATFRIQPKVDDVD